MAYTDVLYEVKNQIAWLTINRPEAHNALNQAGRDCRPPGLFEKRPAGEPS